MHCCKGSDVQLEHQNQSVSLSFDVRLLVSLWLNLVSQQSLSQITLRYQTKQPTLNNYISSLTQFTSTYPCYKYNIIIKLAV